jgi:hypothetical protein
MPLLNDQTYILCAKKNKHSLQHKFKFKFNLFYFYKIKIKNSLII